MESVRLKAKGTASKRCILVDKSGFPQGYRLIILTLLYMYRGVDQLSKWMVNGRIKVSHCRSGNLQMSKGGGC